MDKIFKIGLLVLGFCYLAYLFCPLTNQTGRYSFHKHGEHISILDTTNADLYLYIDSTWRKYPNPRNSSY